MSAKDDKEAQTAPLAEKEEAEPSPCELFCQACRRRDLALALKQLPAWFRPSFTLLLHLADWGSDVLLCRQLLRSGDCWWAAIGVGFILLGGVFSAVMASVNGVRGLRLLLYALGCGPVVEIVMTPGIVKEGGYVGRFIIVRGCETLLEAIPSSSFQLYMIVFRGLREATRLQYASAAISVLSAGYGVMATMRDLPLFEGNLWPVARSLLGSASIASLVVSDMLMYVVPICFFVAEPEFRPWSITAVPGALYVCELLVLAVAELPLVSMWPGKGVGACFIFPFVALASCYSIAVRVFLLWTANNVESAYWSRLVPLWLSHAVQMLARGAMVWLVFPDDLSMWAGFGALALCTTALVWLVIEAKRRIDAKRREGQDFEVDQEDIDEGMDHELMCFCW